jgi:two-component system response regulator YesN
MYHVLLVDDEAHAVRGLQAGIDWDKLQISTVHTANNIRQAKEIFENNPVHLLLCDIEMPQGNGLELLMWVRECFPMVETIFLTCHADFSYAKQALQLSSFDYLLKPVDYGELEDIVKKALEKIEKDAELLTFETTYKHYHSLWESHRPEWVERFWQDLIHQIIPSNPGKIQEYLLKRNISLKEGQDFLPIYIHVQRWYKEFTERELRIMEYALQNAAEEQIAKKAHNAMVIPFQNGNLLAILPIDPEKPSAFLASDCDVYIQSCNQYFYCDLCCYIGEPVPIHEMASMYHTLQKLDEDNVTLVNQTLLLKNKNECSSPVQIPQMMEWAEWMKQGVKDKLLKEVKHCLESLNEVKSGIDAGWLHVFYQDFTQMVFFVLQLKGIQANQVFSRSFLTEKREKVVRSLTALQEWAPYVLEVAMNHIQSTQENLSVVEKVKQFVKENIGQQELNREDVANAVFLNPDYLTRVFKKETGLSLSDYMQQQRLELAKNLLVNSDKPVSEIALTVGYSNLSYFSTIFKKAMQVNPLDYRKRHHNK